MRDRPLSTTAHDFATPGFHPSTVATGTSPAIATGSKNPVYLLNELFYWVPEKCCRNVTAVRYDRRARRAERVVRDFVGIGVRTESRRSRTSSPDAREGYRILSGVFSSTQPANQPIYDPSPPPLGN